MYEPNPMKNSLYLRGIVLLAGASAACPGSQVSPDGPVEPVPTASASADHGHESGDGDDPHAHPSAEPTASAVPTTAPTTPPAAKTPELLAHEAAQPVFEKYCASCHTTGRPQATPKALEHFKMDGYPYGGHHEGSIAAEVRRVLGATGKKATMPKGAPGSVKGDDLALVLKWADAFDAAHQKKSGGHAGH
jgi:mono/diheme cytochrome c family protein